MEQAAVYLQKFFREAPGSYENFLSEKEILYRRNHSIQVEGTLEFLKNEYEFQRFLFQELQIPAHLSTVSNIN